MKTECLSLHGSYERNQLIDNQMNGKTIEDNLTGPRECPICGNLGVRHGRTPVSPNSDAHTLLTCAVCSHMWLVKSVSKATRFAEGVSARASSTLKAEWLLKKLPAHIGNATSIRVLDVGCWDGSLLSRLPDSWTRHGVELNKKAALIGQGRGLNIFPDPIEALSLEPNYYDLVLMMDVLEHIDDALVIFRKITAVMKRGGYFFALTGNGNCIGARIFKGHWYYCNYDEHVTFFSPQSATLALNKVGLETIKIAKLAHHSSTFFVLQKIIRNLFKSSTGGGGTSFLPAPNSLKDRLFLTASRLLRRADHLTILAKKA